MTYDPMTELRTKADMCGVPYKDVSPELIIIYGKECRAKRGCVVIDEFNLALPSRLNTKQLFRLVTSNITCTLKDTRSIIYTTDVTLPIVFDAINSDIDTWKQTDVSIMISPKSSDGVWSDLTPIIQNWKTLLAFSEKESCIGTSDGNALGVNDDTTLCIIRAIMDRKSALELIEDLIDIGVHV